MGLDPAHLAAALSKSQELEKIAQRCSKSERYIAGRAGLRGNDGAGSQRKANATDHLQREKIRQRPRDAAGAKWNAARPTRTRPTRPTPMTALI